MTTSSPEYSSGPKILAGDKIKFSGEDGIVEFVLTESYPNWATYWKDLGPGVMLSVPSFGSVYVAFDDEDVNFMSRG